MKLQDGYRGILKGSNPQLNTRQRSKEKLVLKTNIRLEDLDKVKLLLDELNFVIHWSIDIEDIDKVLVIDCHDRFQEKEVIDAIRQLGFLCESLDT